MAQRLGGTGIWGSGPFLDDQRRGEAREVAAELEELGFSALWLSAGFGDDLPPGFGELLDATATMTVATGIASVWALPVERAAQRSAQLEAAAPGRFLLGLGASHAAIVEGSGQDYRHPYQRVAGYLDDLAAAGTPRDRLVLAALGPRMLRLSGDRTVGAHPYFVPVEHTAGARQELGEGPLLAPEQAVVLETDPARAREVARAHTGFYLGLPNYAQNLRRLGFGDDDLAGAGSDRLVDAVVAWGDEDAVVDRVRAHRDAGADHVCLQVLTATPDAFPREEFRRLAAALLD